VATRETATGESFSKEQAHHSRRGSWGVGGDRIRRTRAARRGYLGERAQAALGGAAVGEVAAVEEAGLTVPQTTTGVSEGAASAVGGAEISAAGPREAGGPDRLAP
jgi:hypothetical protein